MKIRIIVYKPTGKFYTDCIVAHPTGMYIFQDQFKELIANNLPGIYEGGYVVVTNADENDNEGFYEALYQLNEIIKYKTR